MALIRQRSGAGSRVKRGACSAGASSAEPANPVRIETDGSRTAEGILARFRGFVRSRGVLTVGLDRLRIPPSPSSVPGPESATGCLIQGSEPASVSCTALTPDLNGRCGFASPEHRKVQRLAVKSDEAPGDDCSPVCSDLGSIAEVRRALSCSFERVVGCG